MVTSSLVGYQRRTSVLLIASSVTTAITLFAVFRFTTEMLSASWIGAWSLIQGLFMVARVSDSGAGANISRIVAVRLKDDATLDLRNLILAALTIASGPSIVLAALIAPVIMWYVPSRFGAELNARELALLVWLALLNAALAAICNVLLAVCEGAFQLNYNSMVVIAGNVTGLALVVPLLHIAGPAGVGCVYVAISTVQLVLMSIRIWSLARSEPPARYRHVRSNIRLMWRENFHLSGIALIRLSFEPATKLLLSLFAPLIVIAQFELALRVTTQVRVMMQSALQPLLALGARSDGDLDGHIHHGFLRNDRALTHLALGGLAAQVLAAPAIQWFGMGEHAVPFTIFFGLLAVGNAVNTMGLAGYYWQLSSGSLQPLVRLQSLMALGNIVVGAVGLGARNAAVVVAAYSVAFAYGGVVSRSFLPDVPKLSRVSAPWLAVFLGAVLSGVTLELCPASLLLAIGMLCCGAAIGCGCLWSALREFKRSVS